MSNNLIALNNALENISDDELGLLSDRLIHEKINRVTKRIESVELRLEETNAEMEKMKIENSELRDLEIKRHRMEEHRYGYITATQLGQMYSVAIGAQSMGKLLKMSGLAKKQGRTEPFMSTIHSECAKIVQYGDHIGYSWNPEKCIKRIDKWLNDNELIDEFYSIDNETDLLGYISNLYQEWELNN